MTNNERNFQIFQHLLEELKPQLDLMDSTEREEWLDQLLPEERNDYTAFAEFCNQFRNVIPEAFSKKYNNNNENNSNTSPKRKYPRKTVRREQRREKLIEMTQKCLRLRNLYTEGGMRSLAELPNESVDAIYTYVNTGKLKPNIKLNVSDSLSSEETIY